MQEPFAAHPIPQNVTNFEFHLVGDMTLKQFGYLAAGLGAAYLTFVLLAVPVPLLAWPAIVMFAATGAAFAFLPIQERPLDHWMAAFLKAIFKPTRLKYESKILPVEDPLFKHRLNFFLTKLTKPDEEKIPMIRANLNEKIRAEDQESFKTQLSSQAIQQSLTAVGALPTFSKTPPPPINLKVSPKEEEVKIESVSKLPEKDQLKKTVELAKEAQETQVKIADVENQLSQIKSTAAQPGSDPNTYVTQFENVLGDLQKLNEHASELAHELAILSKTSSFAKSAMPIVRSMQQKPAPTLTLTTFPNVINGIVMDSNGTYVEGAVVVAHDKQGLPVRALKTNKLGQFIAATPLPNGVYTVNVEKDNLLFDSIQVELTGRVLNPVIISARKVDPIIR